MRIIVHYHAYGDPAKVSALVDFHRDRIHRLIDQREQEEVERIEAEYQGDADKLASIDAALADTRNVRKMITQKTEQQKADAKMKALEKQRAKPAAKIALRDEKMTEARRRAEDDRRAVTTVGEELVALYTNPDELLKHARVVNLDEILENDYNLHIPRYVDTFEPEPKIEVSEALAAIHEVKQKMNRTEENLKELLKVIGYAN